VICGWVESIGNLRTRVVVYRACVVNDFWWTNNFLYAGAAFA
jgi:hypothetical protein